MAGGWPRAPGAHNHAFRLVLPAGAEFPVLTAVLVAKVASLDPGFAGSPSLSRKPLGAADALCQGRELNYFLKRRTLAASIALCGFKRAYGVTPSSPSRLQPWASLLEGSSHRAQARLWLGPGL